MWEVEEVDLCRTAGTRLKDREARLNFDVFLLDLWHACRGCLGHELLEESGGIDP